MTVTIGGNDVGFKPVLLECVALNRTLARAAAANGATFVDTYRATIGHDVCQRPGVRWVEGLVPASPAFPFHPNRRGQQAMARQVLAALGR